MNEINCQTWTQVFKKALLELNSNMLIERIGMAEAAIDERLHDLRHDSNHHAERQSLEGAISRSYEAPSVRSGQPAAHVGMRCDNSAS